MADQTSTTITRVRMDDGVELYVKVLGDDPRRKKPLFIPLHGAPGLVTHAGPENAFSCLVPYFRVLLYDARGSGASDHAGPYTHERWIEDVENLRRWAGAETFVLAGHSYGGFIALDYALVHGDRLLGLVLEDTWTNGFLGCMNALANVLTAENVHPDKARQVRLWAGALRNDLDFKKSIAEIAVLYAPPEDEDKSTAPGKPLQRLVGVPESDDDAVPENAFNSAAQNAAFGTNMPRFNVHDRLGEITAPTLVLVGRHDFVTPLVFSEHMAKNIPDAKLVIFEKSGHDPAVDEPETFQKAVVDFVKEKKLCDFQYPVCGACAAAGAACIGFDSIHGVEKPRSIVSHLEEEVAQLELQLQHVREPIAAAPDATAIAVERRIARLATAALDPRTSLRRPATTLPLTARYFLHSAPVPYLTLQTWGDAQARPSAPRSSSAVAISSVPRHVAVMMLHHYVEMYLSQYPSVDEAYLHAAFDRVYNNAQPSDFDVFCVHITLAISTTTLIFRDEERATAAASSFWATAVAHLARVGETSSYERLEALQLLTHYGFLNPRDVDCVRCAEAATRLCVQLGLHRDLPVAEERRTDPETINRRRRMFWNAHSIDAAVQATRCLPFCMPVPGPPITTTSNDGQPSATAHFWKLRHIESEITRRLYYPLLVAKDVPLPPPPLQPWLVSMRARLADWLHKTWQSVMLSGKIEFYEMHYHVQMLRLHRPSPSCPEPTSAMQKEALSASIAVLRQFDTTARLGKLFYIWHAAHCIVEAGICLLATVITAIECPSGLEGPEAVGVVVPGDVPILAKHLQMFPSLLWKISRRWPPIVLHATTLEGLARELIEQLQLWKNGAAVSRSYARGLKDTLTKLSLFSPLPQRKSDTPASTPMPTGTSNGTPTETGSATSLLSTAQATLTLSPWPSSGPSGDSVFGTDFDGMNYEEIFQALLQDIQPTSDLTLAYDAGFLA